MNSAWTRIGGGLLLALLVACGGGSSGGKPGTSSGGPSPANVEAANKRDKDEKTPLQLAIEKGDKKAAEDWIAKGADVKVMTQGVPMLMIAAQKGQKDLVELLIAKGADPKSLNTSQNTTVLHYAGNRAVAEYLVSLGLDVNAVGYNKETPLYRAAERGNLDVVDYFVSLGADPMARSNSGLTPIHVASTREVAQFLVSKGCDPIGKPDQNGRTTPPLLTAAQRGNTETLKFFLEQGVDLNSKEFQYNNPLSEAVRTGHADTVEALLNHGAQAPQQGDGADTLLSTAVRHGHLKVAEVLLAHGSDPNKGSARPLGIAASRADLKMMELLVNKGAEVTGAHRGWTALHSASSGNRPTMVTAALFPGQDLSEKYFQAAKWLVDKGADVRAQDEGSKKTPLHCAATADLQKVAGLLIEKGADVNAKAEFDATPLHWAVINDAVPMAEFLINKGADPNLRLTAGATLSVQKNTGMHNTVVSDRGGQGALGLRLSQGMETMLLKHGAKKFDPITTTPASASATSTSSPSPAPSTTTSTASRPAPATTSPTTKPASSPVAASQKLTLKITSTSTMASPPTALVNGQQVEEGQSYQDAATKIQYKIVKIESEQITVSYNGREEVFQMGSSLDSFTDK